MNLHYKGFNEWNTEKQEINSGKYDREFYPKVRSIWYAKLGINIGFESDGKKEFKRPVLILAKIGSLYWIVPLTSQVKENIFHHTLTSVKFKKITNSVLMLSQARIIDKRRLISEIGIISKNEFNIIQKKMKGLYFSSS